MGAAQITPRVPEGVVGVLDPGRGMSGYVRAVARKMEIGKAKTDGPDGDGGRGGPVATRCRGRLARWHSPCLRSPGRSVTVNQRNSAHDGGVGSRSNLLVNVLAEATAASKVNLVPRD